MSLLFPPTPAWRRTRPAAAAAAPDHDSSTIQSDAALPGRPARSSSGSLWQRVTDWLAGDPWLPSMPGNFSAEARLPAARDALLRELADLQTAEGQRLALRVSAANNRQELLHLRSALFELVARVHSQAEAQARLERLAAHFPLRAAPARSH
jgi:small-conductance mechanosensitive channel